MLPIQLICIMDNAFECARTIIVHVEWLLFCIYNTREWCVSFPVSPSCPDKEHVLCLNIVRRVMEVVYSRCVHTILWYYSFTTGLQW